jgi:thiamine biosynthesis protein ThiS
MKRWIPMLFVMGAVLFGVAAVAQEEAADAAMADAMSEIEIILNGETTSVAQGTTLLDLVHRLGRDADDVDVTHNGEKVDDGDLDEITVREGDRVSIVEAVGGNRFGLGIGVGLVNLDEEFLQDDVEEYFTAHLRIAFGDVSAHRGGRPGLQGYLEPEIGIWDGTRGKDTLLGINIIGSIPFNAVDFFVGAGAGIHMLETDAFVNADGDTVPATDDDAFGVNAQFGIDVHLNQTVTVFGTGRFDIINDSADSLEAKVYLGLRFGF